MTRATNAKPTRRVLKTRSDGDLIVELYEDRIALRLKGSRREGPAEVMITASLLYQQLMTARVREARMERSGTLSLPRHVKRGLL